jgi:hypothetical protein
MNWDLMGYVPLYKLLVNVPVLIHALFRLPTPKLFEGHHGQGNPLLASIVVKSVSTLPLPEIPPYSSTHFSKVPVCGTLILLFQLAWIYSLLFYAIHHVH